MATPVALPQTLGDTSTAINALFSAQSLVDVKLERVRFDPGGTPLDFTTFLVNSAAGADGRLWEARYTIDDGTLEQQTVPLGPLNAGSYQTYDVSVDEGVPTYGGNPGALSFRWTAVPIPGTSDTIDVDLTAILASTAEVVIKWRIKFTRNTGATASIDDIAAPIVWLRGPASTDGTFPLHADAQKRTRVLCPTFDAASAPVLSRNIDFWTLSNFGATYEAGHPGISHTYQFFAIVSANNTPDAAYLKAFYYGAADGEGYQKKFGLRGRRVAADGYIQFYCRHIPPFADLGGNKTSFGNEWETPYYAETGVIDCADDHFWFDVCKFYRGRMDAVGGLPPLVETSTVLSPRFMGNAIWFGNAQTQIAKLRYEDLAAAALAISRFLRNFLETANRPKPDVYLHFQQWLNQALGSVDNPSNSPDGDYRFVDDDPFLPERGLREMFAVAARENIFSSGYINPLRHAIIAKGYERIPDDVPLLNRKNLSASEPATVGPTGEFVSSTVQLDSGLQAARNWLQRNVLSFSSGWGLVSMYLDTLGGTGQFSAYPALATSHVQNGGNHGAVTKKQIIEDCRAILKANPAHQVDPDIPIVFTEAIEDGLNDVLDFAQVSYYFCPEMLGPDADDVSRGALVGTIPNVSETARNLSPNIYAAVFHDRLRALWLMPSMVTLPLASNTDWNPSNGKPGLSAAEFTAWHCYLYGCSFIAGLIDNVNMIYDFYVDRVDLAEAGTPDLMWSVGARNRDNTLKDPSNKGIVILNFKRDLSEAQAIRGYGGQFLNFGVFQRPLIVDDGVSTQQANPLERTSQFDLVGSVPERDGTLRLISIMPDSFTGPTGAYQYAYTAWSNYAVLHSMWSSPPAPAPAPNDRVGLVLVNWTESAAEWRATLDPSHYPGLGGTFDVKRLDAAGGEVTLASGLSGTITIGTVGGEDVSLGANIPALSLQIIVFDP